MNKAIILGLLLMTIAACGTMQRFDQTTTEIKATQQTTAEQWQIGKDLPYVDVTDAFYVAPLPFVDAVRPAWWFTEIASLRMDLVPMSEVIAQLTKEYGISCIASGHEQSCGSFSSSYHPDVEPAVLVSIYHSGTIGELIEKLSVASGYGYTLKGNRLLWEKYTTRVFDISFLPGSSGYRVGTPGSEQTQSQPQQNAPGDGNLAGYGGGDASLQTLQPQFVSDGNGEYSNMQANLSVWHDLQTTLSALKSEKGMVVISQASTTVFVRDLPEHVRAIDDYISSLNERLTRQVAIDVQIIEVRMNDGFDYGINWNLLKKVMSGDGLLSLNSSFSQSQTTNIAPTLLTYEVLSNTSDYAGSSLFFNALEQQGHVSVVTSPRVVTLNNQMAELAITDERTYLAASTTRSTINVGTDTTLIPGTVTTGLKLYLLPKITGQQMLLQISGNLSSLLSIDRVESNNSAIETPSVNDKRFFQRAIVPMGTTLMLAGLRNTRKETSNSGMFGQQWLGGNKGLSTQVTEVIVLITPHVIRGGGEE